MTYTKEKTLHLRVSEKESLVCTMNESLATTLITNLIKTPMSIITRKGI